MIFVRIINLNDALYKLNNLVNGHINECSSLMGEFLLIYINFFTRKI